MSNNALHLFQDFTLDLARGCVMRAGQQVHLRPQSYLVLKYLVENKGHLIAKDKLIQEIWQGRAVTDGSLGKCIEEVREALGPDSRQYLRNVRGRGYIFDPEEAHENRKRFTVSTLEMDVLSVVVEEEGGPALDLQADWEHPQAQPADWPVDRLMSAGDSRVTALQKRSQLAANSAPVAAGGKRRVRFALLAVTILVVAAAALIYWKRTRIPSRSITSIAVLPLANVSGDPDMEYLSDGIGENLIHSLSQLTDMRVMSRNSVYRYKGHDMDAGTVGRELSVEAVLTGRVVQRGDALSVSVELINAKDNSHIWGQQYNRKLTDLVSLQVEIAHDISRNLRAHLSSPDERKLLKSYTANAEAYQLYLKGRHHYFRLTEAEIRTAIGFYQQAIGVDPAYALAYAAMADAYRTLPIASYVASKEAFPQAKAAATRALEIDENLGEAHVVLGWIGFWFDWDWNASENQFRRAIELNLNNSDAHRGYGQLLSTLGRHHEAIAEIQRARELDPLTLITQALEGQFLFYAGRDNEAIARLRTTIDADPSFWIPHGVLGRIYIRREMFPEAIAELRKARDLSSHASEPITQLGYALAKSGNRAEALATLKELESVAAEHYVPAYSYAMIHNGLGDKEKALAYLQKSLQEREVQITFIKIDSRWDAFRTDPRFRDLTQFIGLPQ